MDKYKKLFLVKFRVNLLISHLPSERLLGRLNQHSSRIIKSFFILHLNNSHKYSTRGTKNFMLSHHPPWGVRNFLEIFFLFFWVWVGKCAGFFFLERIKKFLKGAKSCGSRSNQASFQNIINL